MADSTPAAEALTAATTPTSARTWAEWFVSHLNNQDELKEVQKFYDFEDFVESLRRVADRGFIRMKTYSNAFIVPVQIDRFQARKS